MYNLVKDKIKKISYNYEKNEDLNDAFKNIMTVLSEHGITDYSLYSHYFNYEPKISYLLFKESYKLIATDSYKNLKDPNNEGVNKTLNKLTAGLFCSLVISVEEEYLSLAAKDAFSEVWGDDMQEFEKTALEFKINMLNRMIKNNPKDKEQMINFVLNDSSKSVYKNELKLMICKIN